MVRITIAMALIVVSVNSVHALEYWLSASVKQHNELESDPSYNFDLTLNRSPPTITDDLELSVISPSGERFSEFFPTFDGVFVARNDLVPSALDANFTGTWKIEETVNGMLNEYEFVMPLLSHANNFSSVPVITSPFDGAVLPATFEMSWTNGVSQCGFTGTSSIRDVRYDSECNFDGTATISYSLEPKLTPFEVSNFRTFVTTINSNALFPVTPTNDTANSTFQFGHLDYQTHSPPIGFSVVPEPRCRLLMFAVLPLLLSGTRLTPRCRKRRS